MEVPVEKRPVTFPCRISTWPWPSYWSLQYSEELSGIQHDITDDHCAKFLLIKLLKLLSVGPYLVFILDLACVCSETFDRTVGSL